MTPHTAHVTVDEIVYVTTAHLHTNKGVWIQGDYKVPGFLNGVDFFFPITRSNGDKWYIYMTYYGRQYWVAVPVQPNYRISLELIVVASDTSGN